MNSAHIPNLTHPSPPDPRVNRWVYGHPIYSPGKNTDQDQTDWRLDAKRSQYIYLQSIQNDRRGFTPYIALMLMVAITVVFAAVQYTWTLSPEIFFHVEESVTTDVTITIPDGKVTTTIPEVPMGESATWEDVHIDTDGTVTYEGEQYQFLYYEGTFSYEWSNQGWLVEKAEDGNGNFILKGRSTTYDDKTLTEDSLLEFLRDEMRESGLYDNEIDVVIQRILDLDMLTMEKPFMTIHYIPMDIVNDTIELSTSYEFAQMRRHFAFYEHDTAVGMVEPKYEDIEDTGYMIHETAVNKF